jgi:hypothetical protein
MSYLPMPSLAHNIPRPSSDRNALWSRAEDGLLVQSVAQVTFDVLGRDWSKVASELPGRLPQQCKGRYRLADTLVGLTFVFLRVTFRGSPFFRSSLVLTKVADSADSARPIYYSTSERRVARAHATTHFIRSAPATSRVPCTSATCLLCVSNDSRVSSRKPAPPPSICYSLTHAHRSIGFRNTCSHMHTGPLVIATSPSLWLTPPRD